jgi:spermidine synthase
VQTSRHDGSIVGAVYALFIVSGFTGLAYEVIWTRLLVRVFGASSFAVTTVLAAYMAGLALGSIIFGRLADRKGGGLSFYGLLELGIGGFAVGSPYLISALAHLYGGSYAMLENHFYALTAVRFVLSFGAILIPTTLMGGTLPVLSKYLATGLAGLTERVGGLYAVNTLGAVGGAAAAGLYILPHLGMADTILLCACLNAGIAATAILLGRNRRFLSGALAPEPAEAAGPSDAHRSTSRQVLATFTLTGFCALAAEVIWTRMLALVVGTTVYAFAIMLATFLLGLGSGSALFARPAQQSRRPGRLLGFTVAAIGLAVLGSVAFYARMPFLYMKLYSDMQPGVKGLLGVQVALSAIIVLLPAFLMGGLFPLVARLYARDVLRVGRQIGRIYAFNTMGSVLGSVAGSFLFLKYVGMETSLIAIGCIYLVTGGVAVARLGEFRRRSPWLGFAGAAAVITVLAAVAFPRIDAKVLTSGVYVYAPVYKTVEGLKDHMRRVAVLFYNEGVAATVSLERFRGDLSLLIDGKADASTGLQDMRTQVMLAQLPLLLHPDPDTVLVVGLGSGVTLGSAETHDVGRIDCVELLDNVVAASEYLQDYNLHCLDDPRAHLLIGDGRNHLLLTHRRYDVIISEPTNPWISGVGDLFTQEFFRMARRSLKPGGLMCAWFHTYNMGDSDVRAMVATFVSVFPEASLWLINDGDIILLGGLGATRIAPDLARRMSVPAVARDLRRIRILGPLDLVSNYVSGTAGLVRYAGRAPLNTDDNMLLEFSAGLRGFEATETIHLANGELHRPDGISARRRLGRSGCPGPPHPHGGA